MSANGIWARSNYKRPPQHCFHCQERSRIYVRNAGPSSTTVFWRNTQLAINGAEINIWFLQYWPLLSLKKMSKNTHPVTRNSITSTKTLLLLLLRTKKIFQLSMTRKPWKPDLWFLRIRPSTWLGTSKVFRKCIRESRVLYYDISPLSLYSLL